MRRRLWLLVMAVITSITISACSIDGLSADLASRAALNIATIDGMVSQGMVSAEFGAKLKEAIQHRQSEIASKLHKDASPSSLKRELGPYISWAIRGSGTNKNATYETDVTSNISFLTKTTDYEPGGVLRGHTYSVEKGYDLLGIDQYTEEFVRILSSSKHRLKTDGDGAISIWDIHNTARQFESGQASASEMDRYFDPSGESLNTKSDIIVTTSLNTIMHYGASRYDEETEIPLTEAQKAMNPTPTPAVKKEGVEVTVAAPRLGNDTIGYDFIIKGDQDIPQIAIRISELNPNIVANVSASNSYKEGSYIQRDSAIYEMIYPVYYINRLKLSGDNSGRFESELAESGLQINIKTGRIYKSDNTPIEQRVSDVLGIYSDGVVDKTSFMLVGDKVVLRDYLEVSYMPEVVDGENWVALGRRIRITSLSGLITNSVGYYLNQDGSQANNNKKIYISDIVDSSSRGEHQEGRIYKLGNFQTVSNYDANTGDQVDTVGAISIDPTLKLGSQTLASTDTGNTEAEAGRVELYGICIGTNPFTTDLYSSWIMGEDTELGNLSWWVSWLKANRFSYGDRITGDKLTNFLAENYSFEMRGQGYIIIDPMTIGKIQDIYDNKSDIDDVRGIRTWFVIVGFLLMAYSILLITSWVVDTNIMGNLNMMGILTMNHWEAIHNNDDIPSTYDKDDTHYITFSKALTGSLIIMGVGVILIFVDSAAIISKLIGIFGMLSDVLYKIIK